MSVLIEKKKKIIKKKGQIDQKGIHTGYSTRLTVAPERMRRRNRSREIIEDIMQENFFKLKDTNF